jgi:hypothetical protein
VYGLKNLLDKNPVTISGALVAIVGAAVISGWISLSVESLAAWNTALVLVLGLFVNSRTANKAVLNELADTPPTVDGVPLAPASETPAPAAARRRKPKGEGGQITPERALSIAILAAVALVVVIVLLRLVPA